MRSSSKLKQIFVVLFAPLLVSLASAQTPVTLTLSSTPGLTIPADFSGLSLETGTLFPNADGDLLFRTDNTALLNLYKTVGVKCIRIGGNSVDKDAIPTKEAVDSLFAFAKLTGADVIYSLKLKGSDANSNVPMAQYVYDKYGSQLKCLSVGNEPNYYYGKTNFAQYKTDVDAYIAAITPVVPQAKFCGADAGHATQTWALQFADAYKGNPHVALVVQHDYQGNGPKVPGPAGRDELLSTSRYPAYQKFYDSWAATAVKNGFGFRLTECNSYTNKGSQNCSETYTTALWVIDYMYWWAAHGCDGVNLHTSSAIYSIYMPTDNGYAVRPIAYGVKAFDLGGHGQLLPVNFTNPQNVNVTAWATLSPDKSVYVTIINKEHDASARDAQITINPPSAMAKGEAVFLTAPKNDIATTSGVTLGGAPIAEDGTWAGKWQPLPAPAGGQFTVTVPAAEAVVVHLK